MKKILIVTGIYPPAIGGSATYSRLLFDALSGNRFAVTVLTYGHRNQYDVRGVRVVSLYWPKGLRHLWYAMKLCVYGLRSDIILAADSSFGAAGVAAFANVLLRKPLIIRVTGDYAWEQGVQRYGVTDLVDDFQKKHYGLRVGILRWVQVFALRSAQRVIVPSKYLKRIVVGWGIAPEKIEVIFNGVSVNHEPVRRTPHEVCEIFSAGRLVSWKGFAALIDAAAQVRARGVPLHVTIAGDGPDRHALEQKIKSSGMRDAVRMTGNIDQGHLRSMLRDADVFILNSGYEGLSHQIIEAMSFGLPIIASAQGGNTELVTQGENGILILYNRADAIASAILELARNQSLRERMGMQSFARAQRFGSDVMLKALMSLLESL